jgi:hypothetical protein
MDSLPVNVRDLIWKHVSGDSQSTAGAMSTTRNVGSRQEQSRLCLFPTSVAKLHDISKVSKPMKVENKISHAGAEKSRDFLLKWTFIHLRMFGCRLS